MNRKIKTLLTASMLAMSLGSASVITTFASIPSVSVMNIDDGVGISGCDRVDDSTLYIDSLKTLTLKANKEYKDISVRIYDSESTLIKSIDNAENGEVLNTSEFITKSGKYTIDISGTYADDTPISEKYTLYYDNSDPVCLISGVTDKSYSKDDVTLSVKISDDIGIDTSASHVYVKGGDYATWTDLAKWTGSATDMTSSLTLTKDGAYSVRVVGTDMVGREVSKTISFNIDKTAPTIEITGIKNEKYVQALSDITATATDDNYASGTITFTKGDTQITESSTTSKVLGISSTKEPADSNTMEKWTMTVTIVDAAGNKTVKTQEIIKDTTKPDIKISGVLNNEFYNHDLTVKAEVSDAIDTDSQMVIKRNGEVVGSKELTQIITAKNGDGKYDIIVTSTDKAGNTSSKQVSFTIDTVPPKTKVAGVYDNDATNKPSYASFVGNEAGTIYYTVKRDGALVTSGSAEYPSDVFSFSKWGEDGVYELSAYEVDKAGNSSESTPSVVKVTKDTKAPSVSIDGVKNGKYYNKTKTVSVTEITDRFFRGSSSTATDADGDKKSINAEKVTVIVTRNGEDVTKDFDIKANADNKYTTKHDYKISKEGNYTITVNAEDAAGNKAKQASVSFVIDKTPPVTKLSGITAGKHYKNVPMLKLDANEEATIHINVKADGKNVYNSSNKNSMSVGAFNKDGDYVAKAYSVDLAGNIGETKTLKFVKDSTSPVISISGVKANGIYNTSKKVSVNINERYYDSNKVTIKVVRKLNGKTYEIPFGFKSTGADTTASKVFSETGEYTVTVDSVDEAGNKARQKTVSFTVDTKKPEIKINTNENYIYGNTVAPTVEIKDDFFKNKDIKIEKTLTMKSGSSAYPHSDKFGNKGGTSKYSAFPDKKVYDGIYKITVTATDTAGNTSTLTKSFTVNKFGSSFTVKSAPTGYLQAVSKDLEIIERNVSDIKDYDVNITKDGVDIPVKGVTNKKKSVATTYNIPVSNFAKDGVYTVNIVTKDSAGNTSESKKAHKIKFSVDSTGPVISYSGVEPNQIYKENSVKMFIEAEDSLSDCDLSAEINGHTARVLKENKKNYIMIDGGYKQNIVITATDMAGNSSSVKVENVTVSTSPFASLILHKGLIIGGVLAICMGAGIFAALKKRKNKAEDEYSGSEDDIEF